MAMTAQVKDELADRQGHQALLPQGRGRRDAAFAGGLHIVSGRIVIEAELDTGAAARRLRTDIAEVFGHASDLVVVAAAGCAGAPATSCGWSRTARRWPGRPA